MISAVPTHRVHCGADPVYLVVFDGGGGGGSLAPPDSNFNSPEPNLGHLGGWVIEKGTGNQDGDKSEARLPNISEAC